MKERSSGASAQGGAAGPTKIEQAQRASRRHVAGGPLIPLNPKGEAPRLKCNIYDAISPESRAALLEVAKEKRLKKGSVMFTQGERHSTTYFILQGVVKTFYVSPQGKAMTLSHWRDGDIVGGPDFFEHGVHLWSATTMKDATVLAIEGRELERLIGRFPDFAQYVVRMLTFKMQWLSVLLQGTCTESVTDRLAHLLLRLGENYGMQSERGMLIPESYSQEELARMVGASRQWVNLTLGRLQRARLISVSKRGILLRDPERLQQNGLIALEGDGPER